MIHMEVKGTCCVVFLVMLLSVYAKVSDQKTNTNDEMKTMINSLMETQTTVGNYIKEQMNYDDKHNFLSKRFKRRIESKSRKIGVTQPEACKLIARRICRHFCHHSKCVPLCRTIYQHRCESLVG